MPRSRGRRISLLHLKDSKEGYHVTISGTAFLYWNVFNHHRDPGAVPDELEPVVREAVAGCLETLRSRAARSGQAAGMIGGALEVPVRRFGALLEAVRKCEPAIDGEVEAEATQLSENPFPQNCRTLTAHLWQRSGMSGPEVVLGLGSTPYLATALEAPRAREAVEALIAGAPERHWAGLRAMDHFAGISDLSFFGQADAGAFERLARDTPAWDRCVGLGEDSLAPVPAVNLGPWGRDYHTPYERSRQTRAFGCCRASRGSFASGCWRIEKDQVGP